MDIGKTKKKTKKKDPLELIKPHPLTESLVSAQQELIRSFMKNVKKKAKGGVPR